MKYHGYKHATLRKAGIQIKRKTEAVKHLLQTDETFRILLGVNKPSACNVIGWIADTSLEYDHEYFNGYLKISVEELHIALRDEAQMLVDLVEGREQSTINGKKETTLFPSEFNALNLVNVIENSKIWDVAKPDN